MAEPADAPVRVARSPRVADEWALALLAEGLAPRVGPAPGGGWGVWVAGGEADRADAILRVYLHENRPAPPAPAPPAWGGEGPLRLALAVVAGLVLFFLETGPAASGSPWLERGAAGVRILAGEPWRAVTALTLHADTAHVLSNAAAGGLFFTLVFRALGPGLGAAAVLAAGALGNVANAGLQSWGHLSVGASTSVFGAIGLLAGLALGRSGGRAGRRRRPWMVSAAGLALLAMLGTGGERTDLWAHFFGLAAGGALGTVAGLRRSRPPGLPAQAAWGGLALAVLLGAWGAAWTPGRAGPG